MLELSKVTFFWIPESYDAEYVEVAVEDVDVEVVDVPYQEAEEPDLITLDEIDSKLFF